MSYQKLCELHSEISLLRTTASTLSWDQETYLPAKAIPYRAKQLSYLISKVHQMATSDEYSSSLQDAEQSNPTCEITQANLREWRHQFDRSTKLSTELVKKASETTALAKPAWKEARSKDDFSIFAPHLRQLLDVAKEKAERWGYEDEIYSALLSNFERGATTSSVAAIFDSCRSELTETAKKATEKSAKNPAKQMQGEFPEAAQKILNREIAETIGFDFQAGRIDTTTHPFCSGIAPYDCRLTTRYYPHTFLPSLFGVLHEAGHGMYEQGLNKEEFSRPAGSSVSLGIHESQSLLWENHVGRSRVFWTTWLPRAQELFPQMQDWSVDDILQHINSAKYSFIRVDADEATYDLHILLRFKIERMMLSGEVEVEDIPALWNEEFKKLFGLVPPNNTQGCLQDIHWAMGGLGYFSTYSLGNFNASQLFKAAERNETVRNAYQKADFAPLLQWVQKNIHQAGCLYLPQELMAKVSGEGTNPQHHIAHLKRRFL